MINELTTQDIRPTAVFQGATSVSIYKINSTAYYWVISVYQWINSCVCLFRVRKQVVNIPSFVVRLDSQKHIDFSLKSPFGGGRPGRVKRKNSKKEKSGGGGGDDDEE